MNSDFYSWVDNHFEFKSFASGAANGGSLFYSREQIGTHYFIHQLLDGTVPVAEMAWPVDVKDPCTNEIVVYQVEIEEQFNL